jgi:hypothetical protein
VAERALVTTATSASTASAYLTWKQAARVRAWCWNFVLLPPALTIFTQALLFSIVGLPGVFLATPMLARIRVLVLDV